MVINKCPIIKSINLINQSVPLRIIKQVVWDLNFKIWVCENFVFFLKNPFSLDWFLIGENCNIKRPICYFRSIFIIRPKKESEDSGFFNLGCCANNWVGSSMISDPGWVYSVLVGEVNDINVISCIRVRE